MSSSLSLIFNALLWALETTESLSKSSKFSLLRYQDWCRFKLAPVLGKNKGNVLLCDLRSHVNVIDLSNSVSTENKTNLIGFILA